VSTFAKDEVCQPWIVLGVIVAVMDGGANPELQGHDLKRGQLKLEGIQASVSNQQG
jgi:hypothetical protein